MSIDRLSAASGLIAALRAEISRKSGQAARKSVADVDNGPGTAAGTRDVGALRRELAAILADVDENDPAALEAARRRVVRSVLLWEFGGELREHPQWQPMLDRIANALAGNEAHREEFTRMVKDLRRASQR